MTRIERLDTLQSVELAEGIGIRLKTAGPSARALAYIVDLMIRILISILIGIALSFSSLAIGDKVALGLSLLVWFLLDWFYPVVFEAGRRGATPGKRALGLRVVQTNGSPITIGQAIVRNFLRFADGMPFLPLPTYAFGVASCLASRRFQRLGDLAAGTVVVYERPLRMPVIPQPPPLAATPVPVKLTSDEIRALTLFRDRIGLWSPARQAEIADHAQALSGAGGEKGVTRLLAMAHWLQQDRERKNAR